MGLPGIRIFIGQRLDDEWDDRIEAIVAAMSVDMPRMNAVVVTATGTTYADDFDRGIVTDFTAPVSQVYAINSSDVAECGINEITLGIEIGLRRQPLGDGYKEDADLTSLCCSVNAGTGKTYVAERIDEIKNLLRSYGLPHDKVGIFADAQPDI